MDEALKLCVAYTAIGMLAAAISDLAQIEPRRAKMIFRWAVLIGAGAIVTAYVRMGGII